MHGQLNMIEGAVYVFTAHTGRLSVNLDEFFAWQVKPIKASLQTDPWGNQLVFLAYGTGQNLFKLYSMGKNRVDDKGTRDDYVAGEYK